MYVKMVANPAFSNKKLTWRVICFAELLRSSMCLEELMQSSEAAGSRRRFSVMGKVVPGGFLSSPSIIQDCPEFFCFCVWVEFEEISSCTFLILFCRRLSRVWACHTKPSQVACTHV